MLVERVLGNDTATLYIVALIPDLRRERRPEVSFRHLRNPETHSQ